MARAPVTVACRIQVHYCGPLVALMKDQVAHSIEKGISAAFVSSGSELIDRRKEYLKCLLAGSLCSLGSDGENYVSNLIDFIVDEFTALRSGE